MMKKTPFTDIHIRLGAKMHEFAGYNMPIEYSGIIEEHLTVCNGVGVFDVSHMGEFWIKGPRAKDFLQRVTTNNVCKLEIGKAQYTCLLNEKGGVIDDIILYRYEPDKYMMVVNASNIQKDWEWLNKNNKEIADLEDASERMALLAIQGPKATATLQKLTGIDLSTIPYYSFAIGSLPNVGLDSVIISNTGYTGAGGFELYCDVDLAMPVWNALFKAGEEFGIKPIGLGARDTLRLEMGFCLYGNELTEETTPLEAGIGWNSPLIDGNDFIGKEVLVKQKADGLKRKLCGFELTERGIPRTGYSIVDSNDKVIGQVTSGTMAPTTKKGIGMGYITIENSAIGTDVFIKIREKNIAAKVVKPPFRKLDK